MNPNPIQLDSTLLDLRFTPEAMGMGAETEATRAVTPFSGSHSARRVEEGRVAPGSSADRAATISTVVSGSSAVKVAHIVLALNMGGLERMVLRLLKGTDRARFAPSVCALDEAGELAGELAGLGVPLVVLGRRPGFDLELVVRLSRWMEREGVRIVHTHNSAPHLYGTLAAKLVFLRTGRAPRVVHTKHGAGALTSKHQPRLNQVASWMSDRVVAVSDDMRALALREDHVARAKLLTIVNGVDTGEFSPGGDRVAARARLGVPLDGVHIGCVARLSPVKNHATLIDAFARLRAVRSDVHLTLVGDGATRAALEWQVEHLGLGGAVTFAGTRTDTPSILAAFDVFALSSLTEGISLTLIEAAASGLPIVATRVGGNAEIIEERDSGLLVPPRDPAAFFEALREIVSMPDRARLGLRGRERVLSRFNVGRMTEAYQSLYTELLAR